MLHIADNIMLEGLAHPTPYGYAPVHLQKIEFSRWPDADFDEKCLQKFWKVMEIDNAIYQDLERFGKREASQNCRGKVLDFCLGQF